MRRCEGEQVREVERDSGYEKRRWCSEHLRELFGSHDNQVLFFLLTYTALNTASMRALRVLRVLRVLLRALRALRAAL